MRYIRECRDLFSMPHDYILLHCISADFKMGAGIARRFTAMGVKDELLERYPQNAWSGCGYIRVTKSNDKCPYTVYNLITKEFYYQKPTLKTLKDAVYQAGKIACLNNDFKIAMPMIGCGLDKLNWDEVCPIVLEAFSASPFEIVVCYL